MPDVRQSLRYELESRGFDVADDTVASRGELYVKGARDLADAMFEFKSGSTEAIETMYQGSWTAGLPPRFAVLPVSAAAEESFELLEQMHIQPLLYETDREAVVFLDLDSALEKLVP